MSLLNPDLETKILQLTKRICGENCKKCRHSLVKNLENRARFLTNSKKRTLQNKDNSDSYHDAIEFTSDSLPRKYRKYTLEQHRTSLITKDDKKAAEENKTEVLEESKKRKKSDKLSKNEVDEALENIKRRILEKKGPEDGSTSKNKVTDSEKEKQLEKDYYDSLKNVDMATLTETMRSETEGPREQYRELSPSPQRIDLSPVQQPMALSTTFPEVKPFISEPVEPARKSPRELDSSMTPQSSIPISIVETQRTESPKQTEIEQEVPEKKETTSLFGTANESAVKSLFSADIKPSDPNKTPFDFLDKINVPIPQGNPLFAPKEQESTVFKPKTDGANFVFGQSQSSLDQSSKSSTGSLFGSLPTQHTTQSQQLTPQLVIPGFGQTMMPQATGSNPFAGQFFKSRRGRGRGRGR